MPLNPAALARRLHFHHLRLLIEVADGGTLAAAAERLNVTRAGASKALREIEAALGFVVFERSASGMRATPTGLRAVEHARLLMADFAHFADEFSGTPTPKSTPGLLRLGLSPFIAECWGPALLARLGHGDPAAALRTMLREGRLLALMEQLLAGELDAALCLYSPEGAYGVDTALLSIESVRREPLVAVAAPGFADGGAQSWAELHAGPWILPPRSTHLRRLVDERFLAVGLAPPVPTIESPMLMANARLAAAGLGITVMPEVAVRDELARGRLRTIGPLSPPPDTHVALILRQGTAAQRGWLEPLQAAVRGVLGPIAEPGMPAPLEFTVDRGVSDP